LVNQSYFELMVCMLGSDELFSLFLNTTPSWRGYEFKKHTFYKYICILQYMYCSVQWWESIFVFYLDFRYLSTEFGLAKEF
jgi:hypothetical protein